MENEYKGYKVNGRPPKYRTAKEMQEMVDNYFIHIKGEKGTQTIEVKNDKGELVHEEIPYWIREPEAPTITGLCLFLGFESRQSFYDMEKKKGFSYTVMRARTFIENSYEFNLIHAKNPNGSIFALKNLGWADKSEVQNNNVNYNTDIKVSESEAKEIHDAIMKNI